MGLVNFIATLPFTNQTAPADRVLLSVAAIDPIEVAFGTAFEDLDLPATVDGTFNVGSSGPVSLQWLEGDYEETDNTYTLYANVIEDGFENGGIQAEIEVTVLGEILDPTDYTMSVWVDAEDQSVGTLSNGAAIANKGNGAITFTAVGTTLSVQVNGDGKKEFVNDGSNVIQCQSGVGDFTKYKDGTTSFTMLFIGKLGITSNPDAAYGICGTSGGTSLAHGHFWLAENRTSQSPNLGSRMSVTKNVSNSYPINGFMTPLVFNQRVAMWKTIDYSELIDQVRGFTDGNLSGINDRVRTTANSTTALGTVVAFAANAPTNKFEVMSTGNGVVKLIGKMEQFIIFDEVLTQRDIRGIENYFGITRTKGATNFKYISENDALTDQYVFGGCYAKNADKSKTVFVTSRGPDHFTPGSDREGVQVISTDDGFTWPASYTTVFSDAAQAVHGGVSGGYTQTGRLGVMYGRYSATTGTYNAMISRYSDDDGVTWSTENALTVPTTSPALTVYVAHENIIHCNNGDVGVLAYAFSGTSLYKIYFLRSVDDWETFTWIEIYTHGSVYINESSAAWGGGDDWFIMSRVEDAIGGFFEFKMFTSDDDLATFSDAGNTDLNLNFVYAHPPVLRSILIDGTRIIELSWVNRGTRRWHFKYALPADLIANGASHWNGLPLHTVDLRRQGPSGGYESGYPFIIHPDNDLKSEGVWFEEASSSVTNTAFFKIDDEWKAKIKAELGI